MKMCLKNAMPLVALLVAVGSQSALALMIDPSQPHGESSVNNNANIESEIEAFAGGKDLTMYYKSEVGGNDSGSFAFSYDTTYTDTPNDPSGAVIEFVGGDIIECPSCYLVVKGGNGGNGNGNGNGGVATLPSKYFFDISTWNGLDDVVLSDFWPLQNAISNVQIWGLIDDPDDSSEPPANVPVPSTLLLLGSALLGLAGWRKHIA